MRDWGNCIAAQLAPTSEAGTPLLTCHVADLARDCAARRRGGGNPCRRAAALGALLRSVLLTARAMTRAAQSPAQLAAPPYAPPVA